MKKTILSSLIFACFLLSYGQSTLPGIVPSPNASDLGHYGNIPVSYYTGRPEITIPLYELEVRGVKMPITLNYDASGVLMNSLPSWTGYNWTLLAGGCITRVIYGINDDRFLTNGDELNYPDWKNYFQTHTVLSNLLNYPQNDYSRLKDSLLTMKYDFAPDIYYFNFMGHSGKFFFGHDGEWKVACDDNIEVIFDYTDPNNYILPFIPTMSGGGQQPKTIKGFVLRDESGTRYFFGGDTDHIEYTGEFFKISSAMNNSAWAANSWYLRRVEDRLGNLLYSFEYERGCFIAHVFYSARAYTFQASDSYWLLPSSGGGYNNNYDFPYGIQLIAPIYLKSIETPKDEKIEFYSYNVNLIDHYSSLYNRYGTSLYSTLQSHVYPNSGQHLPFYFLQTNDSSITPYQYNSTSSAKLTDPLASTCLRRLSEIRKIKKSTGTFQRTVLLNSSYTPRHHLTGLSFRNQQMATEYKYIFTYDNFDLLPSDYLTLGVDHWGYYRGEGTGPVATSVVNYYDSRNPVSSYTKYGMLTQITYPTGGVTKLYYEQNDFSEYQSDDRLSMKDTVNTAYAGGLRIRMIEDYENTESTNPSVQRTFSYRIPSSNKSSGQLFSKPKYWWPNWKAKTVSESATSNLTQFCTSAILPLSNSFGPHVGYSYVTESFSDGKKIVYQYSNISDSKDSYMYPHFSLSCPTPYDVFSERGYKRGKLKTMSIYGGIILKKKTEYIYRTDNCEDHYVWSCNLGVLNYGTSLSTQFYPGGIYKLFYPKYDVVKEISTTYYDTSSTSDTIIYAKKDTTVSVTYGSYNHSVDVRTTKSRTLKRKTDTAQTIYTYPFQSAGIESQLTSSQFFMLPVGTEEKLNNVTTGKKRTVYQNYYGKILPKYELEWKSGVVADTIVTYNGYTGTGALSSFREQGQPVTVLNWTSNDCLLLKKTIGGSLVTDYTYTPFNQVSSVTMPNGDKRYYAYDTMGRLIQISDKDGHVIQRFSYNYINK